MSVFNPQIPSQEPPPESYLNATRPLSRWDIGVNRTAQLGITGAGDVLKNAITGADEIIKGVVESGLRKDATQARDETTSTLEDATNIPDSSRIFPSGNVSSTDSGNDIIPDSVAAPIPAALQSLTPTASNAQTGLISKPGMELYYDTKLDTIARSYRAKYPGYEKFVDATMSQITGRDPANKRVQDLMDLMKATQTNAQAETKEAMAYIASHSGWTGSQNVISNIAHGTIPNGMTPMEYVVKWGSEWAQIDQKTKDAIQQNTKLEGDQKVTLNRNLQNANTIAGDVDKKMFSQILEGSKMSAASLEELANKARLGQSTGISSGQYLDYAQASDVAGDQVKREIERRLDSTGSDGKGVSVSSVIGPAQRDAIVKSYTQKYREIATAFRDQNTGLAFRTTHMNAVLTADDNQWLLHDKKIGPYMRFVKVSNQNGGPVVAGFLNEKLYSEKYTDMGEALKGFGDYVTAQTAAEADNPLDKTIGELKSRGVGGPNRPLSDNHIFKYFTSDVPDTIADTRIDARTRATVADNVFKGNTPPMFEDDRVDEKGVMHPGKHSVLNDMTKNKILDAVWNLSDNGRGPLWLQTKNWVTDQSRNLMVDDVKSINSVTTNPNIRFTWDTKSSQLGIDFKDTFFTNPYSGKSDASFFSGMRQSASDAVAIAQKKNYELQVANINASLQPLIAIAKKEGLDPNLFVFNQLRQMGLDPNGVDNASQIFKSIIGPPTKAEGPTNTKVASNAPVTSAMMNLPDTIKSGIEHVVPHLEDWTKATPGTASPEQIKGTANAAIPGHEWGNPLSPDFKQQHLTTIDTPNGTPLQVNTKAADAFKGFLGDLAASGYKINDIQGYNLKEKKTGGISQHAYGNAMDINPKLNPYIDKAGVAAGKRMKTNMPKNISDIAAKWGITWGGDWTSIKDPMHFEFTGRKPPQGEEGPKLANQ